MTKVKKTRGPLAKVDVGLLTLAVCAEYPDDPSTPSVVLSVLKDGSWYGSIVRYSQKFGEGKNVLCRETAPSLSEVVEKLAKSWLDRRTARDRLAAAFHVKLHGRDYGNGY